MRISDWSSDVCSSDLGTIDLFERQQGIGKEIDGNSSRKTGNNRDIQSFDKTEAERWPCGIGQPAAALDVPENKPAPNHDGSGHTGKKVEPAQPPASESAGMESDHDALRGQRPALPRSGIDGAASRAFEHQGFSGRSDAGCGRSADADDNTFVSRIDDTNIAHRCSVPLPRSTFHQRRDGNKRRGYAGRRYLGPFRIDSLEEAVRSRVIGRDTPGHVHHGQRSEEHTSELQSLMRTSYAVRCLKKKNNQH